MEATYSSEDRDFLASFIAKLTGFSDSLPDQKICIKDINSQTVFCSESCAEFLGITIENILGTIVWLPLYNGDFNIELVIKQEEQLVMKLRKTSSILKVNNINGILTPYLCTKSPIINPDTNNVVGIYFHCLDTGMFNLFDHITMHGNNDLSINNPKHKKLPYLNRRERQVVFLFMSHLSSKEIAEALYNLEGKHITKSTVDSIFNDQLYIKFSVNSRPGLYGKLQELGYDKKIPKEILTSKSLIINQFEIY